MRKIQICANLESRVLEEILMYAERDELSLSSEVNEMLKAALAERRSK